jgi:hypothetical protein
MYGMSKLLPLKVMSDKFGSSLEIKAQMALGSSPMSLVKGHANVMFLGLAIPANDGSFR